VVEPSYGDGGSKQDECGDGKGHRVGGLWRLALGIIVVDLVGQVAFYIRVVGDDDPLVSTEVCIRDFKKIIYNF